MRKLVAAAICLLSLSLSVTTGRKCIKEARTRTGKKMFDEQQLRRVDKALSRAGDIPEGSWICLSHRNWILAEGKRCSMFLQFLAHAQTFDRGVGRGWVGRTKALAPIFAQPDSSSTPFLWATAQEDAIIWSVTAPGLCCLDK